ncbi:MAG: hypothetical protein SF066_05520 [Thermoanaerobaculia bacterium]|nr:hypothetical protein [Thermoanaerobaculia bacterium]
MKSSCRTYLVGLTLLPLALPGLASPLQETSVACSKSAASGTASVLVPVEGATPGAAVTISVVLKVADSEVSRETYQVLIPDRGPAILAAWLGGLANSEDDDSAEAGIRHSAKVEILVDGVKTAEFSANDLLEKNQALLSEGLEPASLGLLPIAQDDRVAAAAATAFVCPNSEPFCRDQFDYCYEYLCEYGSRGQACVDSCIAENEQCLYGDKSTFTTQTLQAAQPAPSQCAFYPWTQLLNPKIWTAVQARYLNQRYESVYCQPTDQTFVNLVAQWTTTPYCYTKTQTSCSGNAVYLGSDCRW